MGGTSSVPYDVAKQQVVSEKVREVMKKFGGIYKKQYGVEILNAVQFELDSREVQPQLLQRKIPLNKATKSLWEGFAYRHLTSSRSWKEQYLVITGDYCIACYPNKQEFKNGGSPSYVIDCTGCILLSSLEHYQSVSRISPAQAGKVSSSPMLHCPTPYPLYLWHSYRLHEYLCAKSQDGQTSWKAVIRDCTRNLESGLSSELESKTLLGAVRAYRQTQQKYGAWEMLSGTEIEVLSNLIMEEALPAVQTDILKKISRKSPEKETAWNGVTDCMYKQVQQEVEQKYRMLLRNCQESKLQIEALARSEYNDIKRCRKDLHLKIQAWIGPNTNKFLQNNVHPYQPSLLESIVEPVSEGFRDIRSMFVAGSSEIIESTENATSQEQIGQMISKLKLLPYNPMAMHPCYDKVETMRENHERLKERFHFSGIKSLVKETQRRMKQILDNAIYTFEQLTHHSMSNCQNSKELASRLQKAQNRVLKKFDYDSSSCRKKLFHESLVQITFPFVLSKLKPACREGLPEFEEEILTEYSSVLKLSNNFEEAVLELISPDICEAIHDVTSQNKHSLLRDSVIHLADSEPNLLSRLAEQPSPWNAARFSSYMPVAEPEGSLPDILDSLKHKQQGGEDNSSKATLPVEGTSETRGDHNSARRSSYGEDPTVNCIGEPVQMRKQKHEAVPEHVVSERVSGDVKEILEAMPADDPEVGIAGAGEPVQMRKQKHEAVPEHVVPERVSGDVKEILEAMTVKQMPADDPEVGIAGAGEPVQMRKQKHEAPSGHLLSDIASGDANEILETMTVKQMPADDPEVGIAGAGEPVQMTKQKHEAVPEHVVSERVSGDVKEILEAMTVKQMPADDPEVGIAGAGEPVQMRKQKHEAPSGHLLSDIASGDANAILETMTVKQMPADDPEVGTADIRAKPGDLQVETEYVDEQDE